jgi:hypothetical protein
VLCYAASGALFSRTLLDREDQAFRPEVKLAADGSFVARRAAGLVRGTCAAPEAL